ncbi:Uma2 family endonuclease [Edaphobacter aggregans]|uniref:Uma2 family endonuclease n=1 Tax=Edaphobacter aggregans TaxID=570835 RepID=UPI00054DF406|nr:Uma2 family endonuclease [Edaphobacter aggregans]
MATSVQISMAEYMRTNYRPDREYVDGELVERNVGKYEHSRLQALLTIWFGTNESHWSVMALTEQRVQVSPTRVRIPDVALVLPKPQPEVLVEPPVLVVEILSPDDSYSDTRARATDYFDMGVHTVWIIDPKTRSGEWCEKNVWTSARTLEVPGTPIWVDLDELFAGLAPYQTT